MVKMSDSRKGDEEDSRLVSPVVAGNYVQHETGAVNVKTLANQLDKEALRLRVSSRKLAVGLLLIVIVLTIFWVVESSSERRDASGKELVTLHGANKFTVDSLGRARERLASKTDVSFYEFLADHHDTKALQVPGTQNVVKEVLLAIEHESAQTAVVLVVQIFSDVYAAWPKTVVSDRGRKRIKKLIAHLEAPLTVSDQPEDADELVSKTAKVIENTRSEILEMKDFGDVSNVDENAIKVLFGTNDLAVLALTLKTALYVNDCRPFLARIDKVRIDEMQGKPMKEISLESKEAKIASEGEKTPAPTKLYLPTEQNLSKATKALEDLENFVNDKTELNSIIRRMLLVDLQE